MNKKILSRILIIILFCLSPAQMDAAVKVTNSPALSGLEKKITLDLRGIEILDLFKFLSKEGNLNIVLDKDVSGKVSMFLKDITIKEAMDIAVSGNNLAYLFKGDVISIMTEAKFELTFGVKFNDKRKVRILRIKYAKSETVISFLEKIKSKIGTVILDQATGALILVDVPEKLAEMKTALDTIDLPMETRIFLLKYADTETLVDNISKLLTPNIGTSTLDKKTRTLIITDYSDKLNRIDTIIATLDRKRKQVLIEAKIVKVELSNDYAMGIDWQYLLSSAHSLDIVGSFPAALSSPVQKFSIGQMPSDDLTLALSILETVGNTELLSNPYITVMDGEEAKILVGQVLPVISETTTTSQGISTSTPTVEYLDLGVKLFVKPIITEDGFIEMQVKPEVSELLGFEVSSLGSKFPKRETSEAETVVTVKDGVTIIIAGLIKSEDKESVKMVPVLGKIPFLGALFRSTSTIRLKSELIAFITPHIISGEKGIGRLDDVRKERKERRPVGFFDRKRKSKRENKDT